MTSLSLLNRYQLFLHFLGAEPSSKVRRNLEVLKKSECSIFYFYLFIYFYCFSFFSRMMTKFSKQKLAEAQERKAKGGLVSGLLSKKRSKVGDVSKDDPMVTPPFAYSPAKRPASPTSSLEVITSIGEKTKKKKKKKKKKEEVGGKPFLPSFGRMLMLLLLRLIRRFLWTA